jgi:predicted kinase
VTPLDRLGPEGYSSEVTARVYATLVEQAGAVLRTGHSAIADAVYARPADRVAIERAATDASVPFVGLWLDAPDSTLIARADARRNDPSDADAAVIMKQRAQPTGAVGWRRLDASPSPELVLRSATAVLRQRVSNRLNTIAGDTQ